jgi:tetraacyldisaccharide 4'-kinase
LNHVDHERFLRLIRGTTQGIHAELARAALHPFSALYGAVVALRNLGYDRAWLAVRRASVPVISVGNLTVGGTGKTPMIEWLGRWFRARGVRVAILSRGYRQTSGYNDEGRLLEENLPDVPHLQNPDRVQSAAIAIEELASELLLLDDAFQHRRIARDVDLVMLDALEPFGLGYLLPRGLLREPVRSLRRADVVVLSRADLVGPEERNAIRQKAEHRAGRLRWVEARHAPIDLVDSEGVGTPITDLAGQRVAAFCGIGNPQGFRRTLEPLCGTLVDFRVFPDHHAYSARDLSLLERWTRDLGVNLALTTQKDLVKLRAGNVGPVPLRALRIGLEILSGEDVMEDVLSGLCSRDRGR